MPTFVIAPMDSLHSKVVSNVQEVKARGGKVISLISKGDRILPKLSDHVVEIPTT